MELIQAFIKSLQDGKLIKDMQKEDILANSNNQMNGGESKADSMYSIILKSISDQILICNKSKGKMEILGLERCINERGFNEKIDVPFNGRVYILYCNNTIITRFLIKEDKIASFSVISKGDRNFFLLL